MIDLPHAELDYLPQWIGADMADHWLHELMLQTPWSQPRIKLYGRSFAVPIGRLVRRCRRGLPLFRPGA